MPVDSCYPDGAVVVLLICRIDKIEGYVLRLNEDLVVADSNFFLICHELR